jgi:Tir chaperone protein (CesT) family
MLEKLVTQLNRELSIENFISSSEDRHYLLHFDHNIEVEAVELERHILLKSIIGASPQQNTEAFLLKAMEANLFGIGTRDAIIGLKEEGKLLTLSLELDYNSSLKDFKEKLEDFINVVDFWREEALNHQ